MSVAARSRARPASSGHFARLRVTQSSSPRFAPPFFSLRARADGLKVLADRLKEIDSTYAAKSRAIVAEVK